MPTIKDIAELAGVSHGTVSNVLNKRGNVSVEKINLVENAAKELGFKLNAQAKQLRQGCSKHVSILVPRINLKRYNDLFIGINNALKDEGYEVDVYYSNNLPHYEKELLERILSTNPTAVVVVSSVLKNIEIFDDSTKFIFVERYIENMPKNSTYVSFDFRLAGKEIAEKCVSVGYRNIAIFCGSIKYSNNKQFTDSIIEILGNNDCSYKVFSADDTTSFHTSFDIMSSKNDFDAIITTDLEKAEFFKKIHEYNPEKKLPAIYALTSTDLVPSVNVIKYEFNYKLCGKKIAEYIIKNEKSVTLHEKNLKMANDGFYFPLKNNVFGDHQQSINILMLSSPTSEALKQLLPSFTLQTGIKVRMIDVSYDELYKSAVNSKYSSAYDLIRLDMVWMSKMGKELFMPLNLDSELLSSIKSKFSSSLSEEFYKVGDIIYSLPFDPSVQLFYYRKDLFESALIKREFFEKYRRQLEVPKTFEEFNEVAAFFTKKVNSNSPVSFGTSLVFGSSLVAACDFLPRFRALGGNIFDEMGRVKVDTPIMKKALENYVECYKYTDQSTNLWWFKALEKFAEGDVAMNIVFANHASTMLNNENSKVVGRIGFAPVPGGHPIIGGGVIGISKNSPKQRECIEFLKWIYNEKTANLITSLGGYINNKNLINNIDILEVYPWIEGMEKSFEIGWRRKDDIEHKNFNEFRFEDIIGNVIRLCTLGIMNVDEALSELQRQCDDQFNK